MKKQQEIQELIGMYDRWTKGEFSTDLFMKAFETRFHKEIRAENARRYEREGWGWNDIDWDKLEAHPMLSKLIGQ